MGGAVLVMLLGLGLFLLWRRKRKQKTATADQGEDESGAAEVCGKSAVHAEAPGSESHHELYGHQAHAAELDSHTNDYDAGHPAFTESPGAVYELPGDSDVSGSGNRKQGTV